MKRAQIVEPGQPLVISEVEIPSPPPKGLVVKTAYSGICHTDLHQWENTIDLGNDVKIRFTDNPYYKLPLVPGHEISGTVYSLGDESDPESEDLKVGDRVVVYPWVGCGMCGYCRNGNNCICPARHIQIGMMLPGGYANFVVIREKRYALKLPDSAPLDVACMYSCSGLTAFNAVSTIKPHVENTLLFTGKANVLLIGAGGLGLWSIQIAKNILPPKTSLTIADISEEKLKLAKEMGCDDTLHWDPSTSPLAIMKEAMKNGGFDAVIDFVNNAVTFERAFNMSKNQASIVIVGMFGGEGKLSLPRLVLSAKTIQGILVGNLQCMKDLMKLAASKKLTPPPVEYYKLEDVTKAYALMKEGKMKGRSIIKFASD